MNRGELLRARRCRLLILAMFFGVLLPVFQPSWVTFVVAAVGEVLLVATYWRRCRSPGAADNSSGAGPAAGSEPGPSGGTGLPPA